MARELYNWDQVKSYSIIAIHNLEENKKEINYKNFVKELDTLQTRYGKEGVIGLANRLIRKMIKLGKWSD